MHALYFPVENCIEHSCVEDGKYPIFIKYVIIFLPALALCAMHSKCDAHKLQQRIEHMSLLH